MAQIDPKRKIDLTSLGAKPGHLPVAHSMISSAPAKITAGIVRPSARAVFIFTTSPNLVDRQIDRLDALEDLADINADQAIANLEEDRG